MPDTTQATTEIEFMTPLLVAIELEETDNPAELVRAWREKFYHGWYKELWEKGTENKPKGWTRFIIKLFWPIGALAILANFVTGASILFLSLVLLPTQIVILAWFLFRLFITTCISAAFELEEDNKEEPRK